MKGLSYEALQLLQHLRSNGPTTATTLRNVTPHLSVRNINNRLARMVQLGYIQRCGRDVRTGFMLWRACADIAIASPPQHDPLRAPVYVPPKDEPAREGALDFKRCPSLFFGALVRT